MRRLALPRAALLCAALLTATSACSSSDGGTSPAVSELGVESTTASAAAPVTDLDLAKVADEVIVPRYESFAAEAVALSTAVEDLCADPNTAALEAARQQWRATRAAWRRTTAFGIGPAMDLRTMSAVDFATSADKVEAVAAGPDPVTVDAVGQLGANARGLGAVEQLLFGQDAAALGDAAGARRCGYAASASELVAGAAAAVAEAWTAGDEPYRDAFVDDTQASLDDVFNEIIRTLQGVADQKLAVALGDTSGEPEPDVADPGPAHRALDDMVDDLDGAVAGYDAVLQPAIARQSADAAARARAQLVAGLDALSAVRGPLATAVEDDSAGLAAAQASLKEAKRTLATEVASLLGLTLTFSDADGDS